MTMRKAFTLIELLVVIAIIAILAAILFPEFAQAKRAAKTSVTISNLKQCGAAFVLYANDHDDVPPRTGEGVTSLGMLGTWNPYTAYQPANSGRFSMSRSTLKPYVKSMGVFLSPLDETANVSGLTFAVNACLMVFSGASRPDGVFTPGTFGTVTVPSEQMLLGEESTGPGLRQGTNDGFFSPGWDRLSSWHAGRTAVLFVDAHVRTTAPPVRPSAAPSRLFFGEQETCGL